MDMWMTKEGSPNRKKALYIVLQSTSKSSGSWRGSGGKKNSFHRVACSGGEQRTKRRREKESFSCCCQRQRIWNVNKMFIRAINFHLILILKFRDRRRNSGIPMQCSRFHSKLFFVATSITSKLSTAQCFNHERHSGSRPGKTFELFCVFCSLSSSSIRFLFFFDAIGIETKV